LNGKKISSKIDFVLDKTPREGEKKLVVYARSAWNYYFRYDKKLPPEYFKRVCEKKLLLTELLFKFLETYIRSLAFYLFIFIIIIIIFFFLL
jgi:hypothetical protein